MKVKKIKGHIEGSIDVSVDSFKCPICNDYTDFDIPHDLLMHGTVKCLDCVSEFILDISTIFDNPPEFKLTFTEEVLIK